MLAMIECPALCSHSWLYRKIIYYHKVKRNRGSIF
jgi:hypothetical protein